MLSGYLITTLLIRERAFTGRIDVAAGRTYLAGLTLAALGTAVIVRHLVSSGSGLLVGLLSWGPLVAVGRVSYGIYLFHLPLFTLVWSLHLAHLPGTLLEYSLLAGVATGSWSWWSAPPSGGCIRGGRAPTWIVRSLRSWPRWASGSGRRDGDRRAGGACSAPAQR